MNWLWLTVVVFVSLLVWSDAAPPDVKILRPTCSWSYGKIDCTVQWYETSGDAFTHFKVSIDPGAGLLMKPSTFPKTQRKAEIWNFAASSNYTMVIQTVDALGNMGKPSSIVFTAPPPPVKESTIVFARITAQTAVVTWLKPHEAGTIDYYEITCVGDCLVSPSKVQSTDTKLHTSLVFYTPGRLYIIEIHSVYLSVKSGYVRGWVYAASIGVDQASIFASRISTIGAKVTWKNVTVGAFKFYRIVLEETKTGNRVRDYPRLNFDMPPELSLTNLQPGTGYNFSIWTYPHYIFQWAYSDRAGVVFKTADPDITMSAITTSEALASWTKSPSPFDYYNVSLNLLLPLSTWITVGSVHPSTIPSSNQSPSVKLLGLYAGATYRVDVWTVQGSTNGLVRSSPNFETKLQRVNPSSIVVTSITKNSARVTWTAGVTGNIDGYIITLSPTTGGAGAKPGKVSKSTLSTNLVSLTPGQSYVVGVKTYLGQKESKEASKTFQTLPEKSAPSGSRIQQTGCYWRMGTIVCVVDWYPETSGDKFTHFKISIVPEAGLFMKPSTFPKTLRRVEIWNVAASSNYTVEVQTVDALGNIGKPDSIVFTTPPPYVKVSDITFSSITTKTAVVTWRKPHEAGEIDYYEITCGGGCIVSHPKVQAKDTKLQTSLAFSTPGRRYAILVRTVYLSMKSEYKHQYVYAAPIGVDQASIYASRISTIGAKVTWEKVTEGLFMEYRITLEETKTGTRVEYYRVNFKKPPELTVTYLQPRTGYIFSIWTHPGDVYQSVNSTKASMVFKTTDPDITMSAITTSEAVASWTKSPAPFDYYNVSLHLLLPSTWISNGSIHPSTVPSSNQSPSVKLLGLYAGATYRVDVWTVQGSTNGLVRSSPNFDTVQSTPSSGYGSTTRAGSPAGSTTIPPFIGILGVALAVVALVVVIGVIVIIHRRNAGGASGKDTDIRRFKAWLISKRVSEATYQLLADEGLHDPAMFANLKPDLVPQLPIRPFAQQILVQEIARSFAEGRSPFPLAASANSMHI